jgi:hypothetical protein
MTEGTVDTSPQLHARMAGVSYLLGSLLSVLGQMVVLGMVVVSGSAPATAVNILYLQVKLPASNYWRPGGACRLGLPDPSVAAARTLSVSL